MMELNLVKSLHNTYGVPFLVAFYTAKKEIQSVINTQLVKRKFFFVLQHFTFRNGPWIYLIYYL